MSSLINEAIEVALAGRDTVIRHLAEADAAAQIAGLAAGSLNASLDAEKEGFTAAELRNINGVGIPMLSTQLVEIAELLRAQNVNLSTLVGLLAVQLRNGAEVEDIDFEDSPF